MEKIISLDQKLKVSAARKTALIRKQKIQAVHQFFQCTGCASKCERCGTGVGLNSAPHSEVPPIPYHFCHDCAQEYQAYIRALQGQCDPDSYWHNHEWFNLWRQWIDYRGAIDQFRRSKEFVRLLEEWRQETQGSER